MSGKDSILLISASTFAGLRSGPSSSSSLTCGVEEFCVEHCKLHKSSLIARARILKNSSSAPSEPFSNAASIMRRCRCAVSCSLEMAPLHFLMYFTTTSARCCSMFNAKRTVSNCSSSHATVANISNASSRMFSTLRVAYVSGNRSSQVCGELSGVSSRAKKDVRLFVDAVVTGCDTSSDAGEALTPFVLGVMRSSKGFLENVAVLAVVADTTRVAATLVDSDLSNVLAVHDSFMHVVKSTTSLRLNLEIISATSIAP
mmetsp:Transcript_5231/g.11522  ORF Transcript_5231/g.11522 Transcript_5231/m.11522 type:complete len:258 (+) Transcript_5231:2244-3017(+)